MLREYPVTQRPTEPARRWFADDSFDLVVWNEPSGNIVAFELSYGKPHFERTLRWSAGDGYTHSRVDSGEATATKNCTPILVGNDTFPKAEVIANLMKASAEMDAAISVFVLLKLHEFPA